MAEFNRYYMLSKTIFKGSIEGFLISVKEAPPRRTVTSASHCRATYSP